MRKRERGREKIAKSYDFTRPRNVVKSAFVGYEPHCRTIVLSNIDEKKKSNKKKKRIFVLSASTRTR